MEGAGVKIGGLEGAGVKIGGLEGAEVKTGGLEGAGVKIGGLEGAGGDPSPGREGLLGTGWCTDEEFTDFRITPVNSGFNTVRLTLRFT